MEVNVYQFSACCAVLSPLLGQIGSSDGTLTSRIIASTHTQLDQRKYKNEGRMRGEEEKESTFTYEDVVPLMSTLPLGSVSLTFMLDHTISLCLLFCLSLFPVHPFFFFLPIIQSAPLLLPVNLSHLLLLPLQL